MEKYMEKYKEKAIKKYMLKIKHNIGIILLFLIISILILMKSPINPIARDNTRVDSSVYVYGSNFVREGKVLYKDCFDHKGPSLYLIDIIGLTITNRRYIRNMVFRINIYGYEFMYNVQNKWTVFRG